MTGTPPTAIRLINVKKHFKDRDVEALGGVNLEVAQAEFITLIVPIPLDRPHERSTTGTRALAKICAMVREALGSGELGEDASI